MSKKYTEEKQKEDTEKAYSQGIDILYKNACINRYGQTSDTKKLYYEVSANWIFDNVDLNEIAYVNRELPYNQGKGQHDGNGGTMREKIQAKALVNYCSDKENYSGFSFIDYEMPITKETNKNDKENNFETKKEKQTNGDVDVLGLSEDKKTLYLMELKNVKNKETLLRSALEIYTYYAQLGLNSDGHRPDQLKRLKKEYSQEEVENVIPCILFFEGSEQHDYYKKIDQAPSFLKLIKKYGIKIFMVRRRENDTYRPFEDNDDCCVIKKGTNRPIINLNKNEELYIKELL